MGQLFCVHCVCKFMKSKIIFPERLSALSVLNRMLLGRSYKDARCFIVLDENTYNHCLPLLISKVSALEKAEFFEVPVGEEAKTIEVANQLWGALLESGADRNSVIINLGGGCVSDLGGFVAAGYKRGIRYINIPTTLVGMVDAAIGGKTAVNLEGSKNQVGFFHLPDAVAVEPHFHLTTSSNDRIAGYFEILKTLLLSDAESLNMFENFIIKQSASDEDVVIRYVIRQCVDFKSSVVIADPKELSFRKLLNFGHTFGHGIESFSMAKGNPIEHGIAVGIGMICELYLSVKKLGLNTMVLDNYLKTVGSLIHCPAFSLKDTEMILTFMRQDKKNHDGLILCTLLKDIGLPVIDVAVSELEIRDALLQLGKNLITSAEAK